MMSSSKGDPRSTREPIFVRATGSGAAGIAMLILDGEGAVQRADTMIRSKQRLLDAVTGDLIYGKFHDDFGRLVDEIIAAPIGPKESSTGNPQVELSCHGGIGAVAAVEAALVEAGFAQGRATELLERAHLHTKLSLIELEAELRLASAATPRQAEFLLAAEALQKKWERHGFDMAMGLRTRDLSWREKLYRAAGDSLKEYAAASALLAPHRVAIAGPVNAGKSTLSNALARSERHIVSDIPGTTLDVLETHLDLRGLNVILADTAGHRAAGDAVEDAGQCKARETAAKAVLRLCLLDGSQAPSDVDIALLEALKTFGPTLLVLNKSDLGTHDEAAGLAFVAGAEPIVISAQSGVGISDLESAIEKQLLGGVDPQPGMPFTRRHVQRIKAIHQSLEQGVEGTEFLDHLRKLVGTRPDRDELSVVLGEVPAV